LETQTLPRATAAGRVKDTRESIAIYGDSESGKTAWAEEILLSRKERLIVIDPPCNGFGNEGFCKALGIKYDAVVYDVNEGLNLLASKIGKDGSGKFRIVFRTPKLADVLKIVSLFVFNESKRRAIITDATLCIDEIPIYANSDNLSPEIEDVIVRGRHSRNNLVGIAQTPKGQTHPLYRQQMKMFVCFRQSEDNAIKFFSDFSAEKANKLRTLSQGEYEILKGTPEQLLAFIQQP
jgi:hypothetical protein